MTEPRALASLASRRYEDVKVSRHAIDRFRERMPASARTMSDGRPINDDDIVASIALSVIECNRTPTKFDYFQDFIGDAHGCVRRAAWVVLKTGDMLCLVLDGEVDEVITVLTRAMVTNNYQNSRWIPMPNPHKTLPTEPVKFLTNNYYATPPTAPATPKEKNMAASLEVVTTYLIHYTATDGVRIYTKKEDAIMAIRAAVEKELAYTLWVQIKPKVTIEVSL